MDASLCMCMYACIWKFIHLCVRACVRVCVCVCFRVCARVQVSVQKKEPSLYICAHSCPLFTLMLWFGDGKGGVFQMCEIAAIEMSAGFFLWSVHSRGCLCIPTCGPCGTDLNVEEYVCTTTLSPEAHT